MVIIFIKNTQRAFKLLEDKEMRRNLIPFHNDTMNAWPGNRIHQADRHLISSQPVQSVSQQFHLLPSRAHLMIAGIRGRRRRRRGSAMELQIGRWGRAWKQNRAEHEAAVINSRVRQSGQWGELNSVVSLFLYVITNKQLCCHYKSLVIILGILAGIHRCIIYYPYFVVFSHFSFICDYIRDFVFILNFSYFQHSYRERTAEDPRPQSAIVAS